MLDSGEIFRKLQTLGVEFYTGVPDSLLKNFCACVASELNNQQHIIAANEGGAIALATGHYLATGSAALVYMQNSGLGNAWNPLLSLAHRRVYGVPMLLMIGWRGEPGTKDEPQHIEQGAVTLSTLESAGIPYHLLPDDLETALSVVETAHAQALSESLPVALVVSTGTFSKHEVSALENTHDTDKLTLSREQAIATAVAHFDDECAFVATTGKASRELYEIRKDSRDGSAAQDFLTVGSMGHSSQIAYGIALAQPTRVVVCLDGDGAALMHMGGMAIIGQSAAKNLIHIILNNGAHDSVGSQPTVALQLNMVLLGRALGYQKVSSCDDLNGLQMILKTCVVDQGPHLIEIKVKTGSREDLSRPERSPEESKKAFMSHIA